MSMTIFAVMSSVVVADYPGPTCQGLYQNMTCPWGSVCCGNSKTATPACVDMTTSQCCVDPLTNLAASCKIGQTCGTAATCGDSEIQAELPDQRFDANDVCPGVGQDCKVVGSDGLACCGSEHGAGFAFCQTSPDYQCCSGASYAISCPSSSECEISDSGLPSCGYGLKANDVCPGVGQDCKVVGSDGLACCGSEHGAGFAFCQTSPDYQCCSGASYAISCPSSSECEISDSGLPSCGYGLKANDVCPGLGQDCKVIGTDGLACCGAEHGAGFAFCQTSPDYECCSGDKWAISCSSKVGCSVDDQGVPACKPAFTMV